MKALFALVLAFVGLTAAPATAQELQLSAAVCAEIRVQASAVQDKAGFRILLHRVYPEASSAEITEILDGIEDGELKTSVATLISDLDGEPECETQN